MIDKELRGLLKPKFCIYKHDMSCDICSVGGCGIESAISQIKALCRKNLPSEKEISNLIFLIVKKALRSEVYKGHRQVEIFSDRIAKAIIAEMQKKWG